MAMILDSASASSSSSAVGSVEATVASRRWLAWAVRAWVVLMIAVAAKAIVEPQVHTVYTAFSEASRDWWSNCSLYVGRAYFYSPTFAVLLSPLAIWPDWLGGACWSVGSAVLLVVALRLFYREVLPSGPWPAATEGKFLLLALVGSLRSFWSGQSNALIVALVLFGGVAIVRGRWWRAAWCLALPVHVKVWPLALGGLLAAQWPRRFAPRFALAALALGLIPLLTKPVETVVSQYRDWYQCLAMRQTGTVRYTGYRDAWTIWEAIAAPVNHRGYLALQATGALAVLGWCLSRGRSRFRPIVEDLALVRRRVVLTLSAWSCWQLLLGPGTERLTYILVAPALAWGVVAAYAARRGRFWITLAFVAAYLFDVGSLERMVAGLTPLALALQPCGVLIFAGWLVRYGSCPEIWPEVSLLGTISKSNSDRSFGKPTIAPVETLPLLGTQQLAAVSR